MFSSLARSPIFPPSSSSPLCNTPRSRITRSFWDVLLVATSYETIRPSTSAARRLGSQSRCNRPGAWVMNWSVWPSVRVGLNGIFHAGRWSNGQIMQRRSSVLAPSSLNKTPAVRFVLLMQDGKTIEKHKYDFFFLSFPFILSYCFFFYPENHDCCR